MNSKYMPKMFLVDISKKTTDFKTYLSALILSGIADVLTENNGYTLFVPSDDAFANLDKDFVSDIFSKNKLHQLKLLLKNHIVKGKYDALDLEEIKALKTLNGDLLHLGEYNGVIYVQNAKIVTEDIETKDGMIQIIDEVLIPDSILR